MTPTSSGASCEPAENAATEGAVTVGSLCTGYGGLDLGLALALGLPVRHAWHVEIDGAVAKGKRKGELTGPRLLLAARFPGVPNYVDLKTLDYAGMEPVDWLTAGYPCQPFSNAGLRLGAADARHLWPYVADTIGALRPRNVLLENVRGHVRRGLDSVLADLASLGYDARWGVVRASDAGAPHRRERIFVVAADTRGERHGRGQDGGSLGRPDRGLEGEAQERQRARQEPVDRGAEAASHTADERHERAGAAWGRRDGSPHSGPLAADPDSAGLEVGTGVGGHPRPERAPAERDGRADLHWGIYEAAIRRWERISGRPAPWATEPRGRDGGDRLSPRFVEWMMGLPAGWVTDVPGLSANEQLKALGNGVVPQQAALALRLLTMTAAQEVAA